MIPSHWRARLRGIFHPNQSALDVDEELRYHIERQTDLNLAAGMAPAEARRRAMVQFGGMQTVKEECRDALGTRLLEHLLQDIRFALRMLRKNPGFATVAVLTLALGIGANSAIFSMVNAVMLKPLPYATGGALVTFRGNHSVPDVLDIRRMSQSFSSVGTVADFPFDLIGHGDPQRVDGGVIAGDVFPALGTPAMLGRTFTEQDDEARAPVAVVSFPFWRKHLASDSNAVGKTVNISGITYTVVGVMPQGFKMPFGTSEVWIPFRVGYPEAFDARGAHFTLPVVRMKPDTTLARAQSELDILGKKIGDLNPLEARTFIVFPLRDRMVGNLRTPLLVLFAAVGCVLLIACSNFANLLLARIAARKQEIQVRGALGAGRWRIVRQLVTESVVLSMVGGAFSIAVSYAGIALLMDLKPKEVRLFQDVTVDLRTLSFALGVSLFTGILFGLAPALQLWTERNSETSASRVTTRSALRRALVVLQLATALVLLVGAGLLLRSFWQLRDVDPGLRPERVATMKLTLPAKRYFTIPAQTSFLKQLDTSLHDIPGVESAGLVTELPLTGMHMEHNMAFADRNFEAGKEPEIGSHEVDPTYFDTVGIPLLTGRGFTNDDREDKQLVGVINESMARQYWPGKSPIGERVRWARMSGPPLWITIVGVVGNVRFDGLDQQEIPTMYTPLLQKLQPWKRWVSIVIRTRSDDPLTVAPEVRKRVWQLDQLLPITDVAPLTVVVSESVADRRFSMTLLLLFAGLALVLAVIGIYGVISYLVTQRTREIGVRMAVGAQRGDVVLMIVRQGLTLTLVGVALGVVASLAAVRTLNRLLFGVSPTDPLTFVAVVAILSTVAVAASYVPALRASRIDPVVALRYE
jgi:putative ABC transport system permease protein